MRCARCARWLACFRAPRSTLHGPIERQCPLLGQVRGDKVEFLMRKLKAGKAAATKAGETRDGLLFDAHCHYLDFAQVAACRAAHMLVDPMLLPVAPAPMPRK